MITQILLIVVGSIVLISLVGATAMNYERQKIKMAEKEKTMYEKCIYCGETVHVRKDTHIDQRLYYVEGAGQMCHDCYDFTFRN